MTDDAAGRLLALGRSALRLAGSTTTVRLVRERMAIAVGQPLTPGIPPLDAQELRSTLRDAWGADPETELDSIDPDPIAVTPTAQVHRGVLDGRPVAVKVLRPGLANRIRQDLALIETLATPLAAVLPRLDPAALVREVRERTMDELDLEHEASATRRVHRALRRHPRLAVPAPEMSLASERVLVTAWVDGVPFRQAPDPDLAAANLVSFVIGSLREGLVHADADPDNLVIATDGRLTVLDFGAVRQVDDRRVDVAAAAVQAYAEEDGAALGEALESLGVLPAAHGPAVLGVLRHALGELGGAAPSRLDQETAEAAFRRLAERRSEVLSLLPEVRVAPEDMWSGRAIVQLFATIAQCGATAPWRELTLAALRDGYAA